MEKIKNTVIATYQQDDYIIEITSDVRENSAELVFDAWIHKIDYGIKMYMIGIPQESCSLENFTATVEAMLPEKIQEYEDEIIQEFADDDDID